jgi:hypothetical protein
MLCAAELDARALWYFVARSCFIAAPRAGGFGLFVGWCAAECQLWEVCMCSRRLSVLLATLSTCRGARSVQNAVLPQSQIRDEGF